MNLIDFILDNAFLLVIILGAISSVLGKGNKKEGSSLPERQKQRPTVTQTLKDYQRKYEETIEQSKRAMGDYGLPETPRETMQEAAEAEISSAMDEYLEKQEELRRKAEAMEQKIGRIKDTSSGVPSEPKKMAAFSKNPVVNGLIMAEVLGPPKSKRSRRI